MSENCFSFWGVCPPDHLLDAQTHWPTAPQMKIPDTHCGRDYQPQLRLQFFSFSCVTSSWNCPPEEVVSTPSLNAFRRLDEY